jgi:predicted kinase
LYPLFQLAIIRFNVVAQTPLIWFDIVEYFSLLSICYNNAMIHLERRVVAISGLSLSGKTSLGQALAEKTDAVFLDVDKARQEISGGTQWLGPEKEYEIMLKTYACNHERASKALRDGKATIIAATYSRPVYHEMLKQLALRERAPLSILFLEELSRDAVSERMIKRIREGGRSNIISMEGYSELRNRYQPPTGKNVITFDANQTLTQLTEAALNALSE